MKWVREKKSLGRLQYCRIHVKRMNHQLIRCFPFDTTAHFFFFFAYVKNSFVAAVYVHTHTHKDTRTYTFMYALVCDSFRLLPTAAVWYFRVEVIMLSWNRGSPWGGLWAAYLHTVWTLAPILVVTLQIVSNNPPSARKTTNLTKYLIAVLLSAQSESGTFVFSI